MTEITQSSLNRLRHAYTAARNKVRNATFEDVKAVLYEGVRQIVMVAVPSLCGYALEELVTRVFLNPLVRQACVTAINLCIAEFRQISAVVYEAIIKTLTTCSTALTSSLTTWTSGLLKGAAATKIAKKSIARKATVASSFKNTLLFATALSLVTFTGTTTYSLYQYKKGNILWEDTKKNVAKEAVATGGSIVGSTIGASIGTALCPGFGTVLGGVIGGMVGSRTGNVLQ